MMFGTICTQHISDSVLALPWLLSTGIGDLSRILEVIQKVQELLHINKPINAPGPEGLLPRRRRDHLHQRRLWKAGRRVSLRPIVQNECTNAGSRNPDSPLAMPRLDNVDVGDLSGRVVVIQHVLK